MADDPNDSKGEGDQAPPADENQAAADDGTPPVPEPAVPAGEQGPPGAGDSPPVEVDDPPTAGTGPAFEVNPPADAGGIHPPPSLPSSSQPTAVPINFGRPAAPDTSTPPTKENYNPDLFNDKTRNQIAWVLLIITAAIIVFTFSLTCWTFSPYSKDAAENLKALLAVVNVIFGPVIALLGSVIGFYFGSRAAAAATGNAPPK